MLTGEILTVLQFMIFICRNLWLGGVVLRTVSALFFVFGVTHIQRHVFDPIEGSHLKAPIISQMSGKNGSRNLRAS